MRLNSASKPIKLKFSGQSSLFLWSKQNRGLYLFFPTNHFAVLTPTVFLHKTWKDWLIPTHRSVLVLLEGGSHGVGFVSRIIRTVSRYCQRAIYYFTQTRFKEPDTADLTSNLAARKTKPNTPAANKRFSVFTIKSTTKQPHRGHLTGGQPLHTGRHFSIRPVRSKPWPSLHALCFWGKPFKPPRAQSWPAAAKPRPPLTDRPPPPSFITIIKTKLLHYGHFIIFHYPALCWPPRPPLAPRAFSNPAREERRRQLITGDANTSLSRFTSTRTRKFNALNNHPVTPSQKKQKNLNSGVN